MAACFISIVPGYISRSVAGSYDNEGIAIFCMLFTYYLWIKSVKTGQIYWAALCSVAYFYMVSSWGGYVFLINLIPMHVFTLIICGRFTHKIYIAYSTVYCLGTLLSMQISFVGFQPVQTSEHMLVSLKCGNFHEKKNVRALLELSLRTRKFKKSPGQKLVKSNKSISQFFFYYSA